MGLKPGVFEDEKVVFSSPPLGGVRLEASWQGGVYALCTAIKPLPAPPKGGNRTSPCFF